LGLLVGELSVLTAIVLHCGVLILGGENDWQVWALIDLIVHLPIAVLEGVILGSTVAFLARVKPEMLGWRPPIPLEDFAAFAPSRTGAETTITAKEEGVRTPDKLPGVLGLVLLLGVPTSAYAHKLEMAAVLRPGWQVQVEGWYETGEPAADAAVQVWRDAERVADGRLDERGIYVFSYERVAPLRVVVNAGGGHRAETRVPADILAGHVLAISVACVPPTPAPLLAAPLLVPVRLAGEPVPVAPPLVQRQRGPQFVNLAIGLGLLLGGTLLAVLARRFRKASPTAPA
jgi:hypothetical protein